MNDPKILLIIRSLAKAARIALIESSDDLWALSEAGQVFEAALWRLEVVEDGHEMPERVFPTRGPLWFLGFGWHSPVDILMALARLDGDSVFGPYLNPCRLRTPLLRAYVGIAEELGRPWPGGAYELSRRDGLAWRLRDLGLLGMPVSPNSKHIVRDTSSQGWL